MADFKEAETKRIVEGGELSEVTSLEWIEKTPDSELLSEAGAVRCGKKGTVSIYECSGAYTEALGHMTEGGRLSAAYGPLVRRVREECGPGLGCVVLRKVFLGGPDATDDASTAWRTLAMSEALGRTLAQGGGGGGDEPGPRVRRLCTSQALGNEAPMPDSAIDLVAVSCGRPAKSKCALQLATADALLRAVSLEAKGTLRRPMNYAYAEPRPGLRADGSCATRGSAPCLDQDDAFRKTLRFSTALKANVEWCDDASGDAVDALGELEAAAPSCVFPFDLRAGDVLVMDAKRWLFSFDAPPHDDDGLAWSRGVWMPKAALRHGPERAPVVSPYLLKAWIATRARGPRPPEPPEATPPRSDQDDDQWLANLVRDELKVQKRDAQ